MKTNFIFTTATIIALAFSTASFADTDHANKEMNGKMDHAGMDHSKMTPKAMEAMHKSMEAEMTKIINTADLEQRKKLFLAHKEKMKSMQGMMKGKCAK